MINFYFAEKVDQYTFESLHNIASWWEEAETNVKLKRLTRSPKNGDVPTKQDLIPESRNELLQMYNNIFEILLSRKLPLSSHEIDDFDQVGRE